MKYKKEYLKAGGTFCPFCRGEDISGEPVEIDAGWAYQEMSCAVCEGAWQDEYKLKNVVTLEDPPEETG